MQQLHLKLDVKAYIYALLSTTKPGHFICIEIYILYAYFFPEYKLFSLILYKNVKNKVKIHIERVKFRRLFF